ncbi:unnamed protein product [Phytomonas sp. EM1]|nr:unnamed protein product [Phytomonas sp. EM1]|eukprot:CCW61351.1 unnamed protein product [Phytomonas sp. isolate EM1]
MINLLIPESPGESRRLLQHLYCCDRCSMISIVQKIEFNPLKAVWLSISTTLNLA